MFISFNVNAIQLDDQTRLLSFMNFSSQHPSLHTHYWLMSSTCVLLPRLIGHLSSVFPLTPWAFSWVLVFDSLPVFCVFGPVVYLNYSPLYLSLCSLLPLWIGPIKLHVNLQPKCQISLLQLQYIIFHRWWSDVSVQYLLFPEQCL